MKNPADFSATVNAELIYNDYRSSLLRGTRQLQWAAQRGDMMDDTGITKCALKYLICEPEMTN